MPAPEVEENEPALVEARAAWPVEIQSAAIETASLPALAGDPPTANASMTEASAGEHVSSARDDNAESSAQDSQAIHEAAREEASAELAPPPTAEVEQGVSYASNTESASEKAAAMVEVEEKLEPAHPIQTVTEKPANPRRGWWQRLIQP
ncbi:MAG: hypothetical protein WA633_15100 [Stellaceae bacterium]